MFTQNVHIPRPVGTTAHSLLSSSFAHIKDGRFFQLSHLGAYIQALPDRHEVVAKISSVFFTERWQTLTLSNVMRHLQSAFPRSGDLSSLRGFVNNHITKMVMSVDRPKKQSPPTVTVDIAAITAKQAAAAARKAKEEAVKQAKVVAAANVVTIQKLSDSATSGGLNTPVGISAELAEFVGVSPYSKLARTQVVKFISEYVKKHDLQDPSDRRQIQCDARLRGLLGQDRVTFFTINKYLSHHFEKKRGSGGGRIRLALCVPGPPLGRGAGPAIRSRGKDAPRRGSVLC